MNAKIKYVLINLFSKLTASPVAIFDSLFTVVHKFDPFSFF